MTRERHKKPWITLAIIITIITVLTISLNSILENTLQQTINSQIKTYNSTSAKKLEVGKISLNIWARTLTINDIRIVPDSSMFKKLKQGSLEQMSILEINIPHLKINRLGIFEIVIKRKLSLKKILLNDVEFTIYKNELNVVPQKTESKPSLDSISVAKLKSISLGKIEFNLFRYTTINVNTNDTIFSFSGNNFEIDGLELDKVFNSERQFNLNTEKLSLKMREQRINLQDANYIIILDKLNYSFADGIITSSNFAIKPAIDKYKLGASYKYTKEVFGVEVKSVNIFGYKIAKGLKQGIIDIDSILIDGANIDIYKDRHLPFDLDKRPLLIQQKLKALKQPLYIKNVRVNNCNFNFTLQPEGTQKLLHVSISDISGNIGFITSIKDSLKSDKNLTINFDGVLMDASPLSLTIKMPYNSPVDSFYFSGKLGRGNLPKFNPALYPATGIKFNGGHLNSLNFYAHASPNFSVGQMTMLYNDLEAEINKKNVDKKNKLLSFGANTVLRVSNPTKKGKTRISTINIKRTLYKGFGNLLWKTVQSGVINTILPTGKSYKKETESNKTKTKKRLNRKRK